jgi:hypothetical protein
VPVHKVIIFYAAIIVMTSSAIVLSEILRNVIFFPMHFFTFLSIFLQCLVQVTSLSRFSNAFVYCWLLCVIQKFSVFNPFTAEVAIMRLLDSALKSHLCDQKRRSKVTGLSDLMTLFIDLGCLYCKQTQRAFNVFKNTLDWLKIDSVDQKFYWLECGNFSQDAGTSGTGSDIAFSQLAVKGLIGLINMFIMAVRLLLLFCIIAGFLTCS